MSDTRIRQFFKINSLKNEILNKFDTVSNIYVLFNSHQQWTKLKIVKYYKNKYYYELTEL